MRPRMNGPQNMRPGNQASPIKRDPGGGALQAKRRKVDVLTPSDKDDDDCQVICMQPKNTGLPQIESIQVTFLRCCGRSKTNFVSFSGRLGISGKQHNEIVRLDHAVCA